MGRCIISVSRRSRTPWGWKPPEGWQKPDIDLSDVLEGRGSVRRGKSGGVDQRAAEMFKVLPCSLVAWIWKLSRD
eukprot:253054-Pyramimonas_sp.AAC.1